MVVFRTITFAVDDMDAAVAPGYAVMQKIQQLLFCCIAAQSMQVDFRLLSELAFAQFF